MAGVLKILDQGTPTKKIQVINKHTKIILLFKKKKERKNPKDQGLSSPVCRLKGDSIQVRRLLVAAALRA